jgi:hypothetical protein
MGFDLAAEAFKVLVVFCVRLRDQRDQRVPFFQGMGLRLLRDASD